MATDSESELTQESRGKRGLVALVERDNVTEKKRESKVIPFNGRSSHRKTAAHRRFPFPPWYSRGRRLPLPDALDPGESWHGDDLSATEREMYNFIR